MMISKKITKSKRGKPKGLLTKKVLQPSQTWTSNVKCIKLVSYLCKHGRFCVLALSNNRKKEQIESDEKIKDSRNLKFQILEKLKQILNIKNKHPNNLVLYFRQTHYNQSEQEIQEIKQEENFQENEAIKLLQFILDDQFYYFLNSLLQNPNIKMVTEDKLRNQNKIVQASFINRILEKQLIESTYNLEERINDLFELVRDQQDFIQDVERVKEEILNIL